MRSLVGIFLPAGLLGRRIGLCTQRLGLTNVIASAAGFAGLVLALRVRRICRERQQQRRQQDSDDFHAVLLRVTDIMKRVIQDGCILHEAYCISSIHDLRVVPEPLEIEVPGPAVVVASDLLVSATMVPFGSLTNIARLASVSA